MARRFICPHCCTIYNGNLSLGAATRCGHCHEDFRVLPFHGDQNSIGRMMGGAIFEMFRGKKCPGCGVRDSVHLGNVDCGQRVVSGLWHNGWQSFHMCKRCHATWYYFESCEA